MKCLKNPRYRHKKQADFLGRAMEINIEHIANLLYTCRKLYPKTFTKKACGEFILEYMDTVKEFNEADDDDVKDHLLREYLRDTPYLSKGTAEMLLVRLKERPMNRLDKAIYNEPTFSSGFAENLLLMLLQLHYNNGIGQTRMQKIVETYTYMDKPLEWLTEALDVSFEGGNYDVYKYLDDIARARKKHTAATLREQYDARENLQALKNYQDEVKHGT